MSEHDQQAAAEIAEAMARTDCEPRERLVRVGCAVRALLERLGCPAASAAHLAAEVAILAVWRSESYNLKPPATAPRVD